MILIKKWYITSAVILIGIVVCFLFLYEIENNTDNDIDIKSVVPSTTIEINNRNLNLGEIKQGDIVKADFIIKNSGDELLIIYNINPDCLCSDAILTKNIIQPNDTAKISLMVNTKGKSGFYNISSTITANTKDAYYVKVLMKITE